MVCARLTSEHVEERIMVFEEGRAFLPVADSKNGPQKLYVLRLCLLIAFRLFTWFQTLPHLLFRWNSHVHITLELFIEVKVRIPIGILFIYSVSMFHIYAE